MVFVTQGVFVPPSNRCCTVHLYKGHLSYEALNMIEGNIADVMCLDSNGVVNLLKECFDTFGKRGALISMTLLL